MKFSATAVVLLAAVAVAVAQDATVPTNPKYCFEEGWKIEPGKYVTSDVPRPSYDTFFNPYTHEEFMWVHSGTNIDFYSLTDKTTFDAQRNPTLAYTIPAGSTCKTAESFVIGDNVVSIHGDDVFCTCNWQPDKPCPSRLKMEIPGQAMELLNLAGNAVIPVDTVQPDVSGVAALAVADESDGSPASWACTPLINPEEIAGKYCITDRGGCFFQTKYDNCMNAGAIAAIVVNRDDSVLNMGVQTIAPNDIFIMIGSGDGQKIKDGIASGADVTLTAGRTTGPPAPLPEYTQPDAMGVTNMYTGDRILDKAPFILAEEQEYDHLRKLLYVFEIDGNKPAQNIVMNMTMTVDGSYPVIGTFGSSSDRSSWQMLINDAGTFLIEVQAWDDLAYIYDANGENTGSPKLISTINFQTWCPDLQWRYSGIMIHPSGDYVYAAQGLRSPICPDFDGDGTPGDYVQEIYDVKDPANPKYVGSFVMNEVEEGAVTLNGGRWEWGPNGLAGISMTSGGFVLYDFSDPLNPMAVSEIYDPAENRNDFTAGVFSSRYGDDGYWYVYEKDGLEGIHGEFHQLKAVDCDKPSVCKAYD